MGPGANGDLQRWSKPEENSINTEGIEKFTSRVAEHVVLKMNLDNYYH